jgi:hypothetical protein
VTGKATLLRSLYQRALQQPIQELDVLWAAFSASELATNKTLGQALLGEYKPRYQASKEAAARRMHVWQDVYDHPCHAHWLPRPLHQALSPQEQTYYAVWRAALSYETKPTVHNTNDDAQNKRAILAYKQALLVLRHLPDIWYDYVVLIERLSTDVAADDGDTEMQATAQEKESSVPVSSEHLPEASLVEIRTVWSECARAMPYASLPVCLASEWEELGARPAEAKQLLEARILSRQQRGEQLAHRVTLAIRGVCTLAVVLVIDPLGGKLDAVLCVQLMRLVRRTEGVVAARESLIMLRKKAAAVVPAEAYVFAVQQLYDEDAPKTRSIILERALKEFPQSSVLIHALVRLAAPTEAAAALDLLAQQQAAAAAANSEAHLLTAREPKLNVPWAAEAPTATPLLAEAWATHMAALQNGLVPLGVLVATEQTCARALQRRASHPMAAAIDRASYLGLVPCSLAYRRMWCNSQTLPTAPAVSPPTAPPTGKDVAFGPYLERFLARLPSKTYFGGPYLPPSALLQLLSRKRACLG